MKLHEEGLTSENINELAGALAKAQAQVEAAIEDKVNPHFKSSYASLYSIWCACKEAITANGLCVSQPTNIEGDILMLHTILIHSSGQWIRSKTPVTASKMTPQAIGSATTYMRRYSLAAIVGVAPGDDDDGNAAEDKSPVKEVQPVKIIIKDKGYDDFVEKHDIKEGSKSFDYINELATRLKKTTIQTINSAIKNEEGFLKAFKEWSTDRE